MSDLSQSACPGCGFPVPYQGRGRPRRWHPECRTGEIAAKQRAYREENREEIAAKKRARSGRLCRICGEAMRQPPADGLCGFCREELGQLPIQEELANVA